LAMKVRTQVPDGLLGFGTGNLQPDLSPIS
jgi:hypothetical protein